MDKSVVSDWKREGQKKVILKVPVCLISSGYERMQSEPGFPVPLLPMQA